ncbi:FUSC family protein, partial [Streptomyces sp. CHB9.2]|nr:FUSC family protein [Streptomyces sp. CHB9.2]
FPWITGLPLLLLTLAPVFMLGTWISLRPGWMGYGLGCLVFFCFTSIPDNPPVYDAYAFINNGIAVVLSMVITAAVSAVL